MKHILLTTILIVSTLLISGCNGKTNTSSNNSAVNSESYTQTAQSLPGEPEKFGIEDVRTMSEPDKCIVVTFSDNLEPSQDLRGLFSCNCFEVKTSVDANCVTLYPVNGDADESGLFRLTVHAGIESDNGQKTTKDYLYDLSFGRMAPSVELVGKGVIAPMGEAVYFPFRAVGLNAVDVRIMEVFADNMRFFLQDNDLDEKSTWTLKRMGRTVCSRKIDLTDKGAADLDQWNIFKIDLSKLIDFKAGTLYSVEIGIRKAYTLHYNNDNFEAGEGLSRKERRQSAENHDGDKYLLPIEEEATHPEYSYQNAYYDYCFNWNQMDNPSHASYYNPYTRFVRRNVLSSDLGLMAKKDAVGKTHVFVTNLSTANAVDAAQVSLYDYQMQEVGHGKTRSDGSFVCSAEGEIHSILVRKGEQVGYLRLGNGSQLPSANFDTGGKKVQKGIKGFLYADRGVWRPGDSIYLNFILQDRDKTLPQGYPINVDIYNAKGQMVQRMVQKVGNGAIYPFHFATCSDDATGNWLAIAKAGNIEFRKTLQVESVRPNRLKIDLAFPDTMLSAGKQYNVTLSANWLTGAAANGQNATVDVTFKPFTPVFKGFKEYSFSAPSHVWYGSTEVAFDGQLDANGKASFNFRFNTESFVPGMLRADFTSQVAEGGGGSSIRYTSQAVSPYRHYAGIRINYDEPSWQKLDNDRDHEVQIVTVDEKGHSVPMRDVTVKLYDLEYRWWYQGNDENLASYVGETYHSPVMTRTVNTKNGKASVSLPKDDERYGSYLLTVALPDGYTAGQVIYFGNSWGARPQGDAQVLALKSDKGSYKTGETVQISFPSTPMSKAIVTVEGSHGIISEQVVSPTGNTFDYSFVATAEMTPNVYVSVHLLQPHAQTANDLPIRLFGVMPVIVEDPASKLLPVLIADKEVRPAQPFTIKVKEAEGRAMDYTIAIVDEGLLDLTNFRTPDPWGSFFAREALSTQTFDLYNNVIGAFGSRLESMMTIGGSDEMVDISKKRDERFTPIVKVLGPFHLNAGKKASHSIELEPYLGSVRAMVVAASEGQYGSTSQDIAVRQPLMVQASLPAFLAPDEQVNMPVSVFTTDKSLKDIRVRVETDGALTPCFAKDTIVSSETQDFTFAIRTTGEGMSHVRITATSGSETSKCEMAIVVHNPNPVTTKSQIHILKAGEKWSKETEGIGQSNRATLELSTLPPLSLGSRLSYLTNYPHGCAEQSVSAVFPQLYLPKLLDLSKEEVSAMNGKVAACISKLPRFQTSSGGFSTWPGAAFTDDWTSCYVTYFLTEASRAGYDVPATLMQQSLSYLIQQAKGYRSSNRESDSFIQAYRLWVLANADKTQIGAMNRLRTNENLSNQSRYLLANAYLIAGQQQAADALVDLRNVKPDASDSHPFGSDLRDRSLILQYLTASKAFETAMPLATEIATELSGDSWQSTQATAYALLAIEQFAIASAAGKNLDFNLSVNGSRVKGTSGNITYFSNDLPFKDNKTSFELQNSGSGSLFAVITNQGIPTGTDTEALSNGLAIKVSYRDLNGNPIDVTSLPQGTNFTAEVEVTNTSSLPVSNLVLTQPFANGWEIVNERLAGEASDMTEDFDFQDIRDDRVMTCFSLGSGASRHFTVRLNASWQGSFILPPTTCEAMYDRSRYFAKTAGRTISVRK